MEDDNQDKIFEDAKRAIKESAYFMRKALEEGNLREGLKNSANMVNELRTCDLSPKNYYVIFMEVFDELRTLEMYFREEYRRGRKLSELYESVQHASFVLTRIYLLITIGSVYIASKEVPAKAILNDLLEMLKGVQHPVKGLFVRYYLLKMCKDKLPDQDSQYESEGGDLTDAMNFILTNLTEMNKLWIRMQAVTSKDRAKRDKQRNDLKMTIGENIVRLSSLNGCTIEVYKNFVIDKLVEIITSSNDAMSQQYLIDCIIQAFPDDYHLETLEKLLQTCGSMMQNGVDVKTIFIRLMDRLSDFATSGDNSLEQIGQKIDIFSMFKKNIDLIISEQGYSVDLTKILELEVAFLRFVGRCYPGKIEYVNQIMDSCCTLCKNKNPADIDEEAQKNIVSILTIPLERLSIAIFSLDEFPNLMKYLPFKKRKTVALKLAQSVARSNRVINSIETIKQLLYFLRPILQDDTDIPFQKSSATSEDLADLEDEQFQVARIVHLAVHDDPNQYFEMLELFKDQFYAGGEHRMKYTLPALIFCYIKLVRYIKQCHEHSQEPESNVVTDDIDAAPLVSSKKRFYKGQIHVSYTKIFQILKGAAEKLVKIHPQSALRLNLAIVNSISEVDDHKELDEFTYEICSNSLLLYQDRISDREAKITILALITGAFQRIRTLGEENYDILMSNTLQYSAKLQNKPDQCLAILQCSHLFFTETLMSEQRVMDCFKKVLKIADAFVAFQPDAKSLKIYVAILNKFIYFLENPNFTIIHEDDVQRCINLISQRFQEVTLKPNESYVTTYFKNTLEAIKYKKQSNPKFPSL